MAFPAIAATNTSQHSVAVTSHTVALPAGIVAGNLLIVAFACASAPSIALPAGWTRLWTLGPGGAFTHDVSFRVADGTEGASIVVTTSAAHTSAHATYRITGHQADPVAGAVAQNWSANPDPPAISPAWGAADTLWIAAYGWHGTGAGHSAFPPDYTLNQIAHRVPASGPGVALVARQRNITIEDPGPAVITGPEWWVANTIAVRPAAVVAAVPGVSDARSDATGVASALVGGIGSVDARSDATGVASALVGGIGSVDARSDAVAVAQAAALTEGQGASDARSDATGAAAALSRGIGSADVLADATGVGASLSLGIALSDARSDAVAVAQAAAITEGQGASDARSDAIGVGLTLVSDVRISSIDIALATRSIDVTLATRSIDIVVTQ